jgi:ligand-binding sensor protein
VGAYLEDEDASGGATATSAGSAYIFKQTAGVWAEQQKIVASDRAAGDAFGSSVAISGDYAIVGARSEDEDASGGATASAAGSAYIFKQIAGVWAQQQKIVANDRAADDYFGYRRSH